MTPSALSPALPTLETRLGVRLLTPTTRSAALTEAGERLWGRVAADGEGQKDAKRDGPRGINDMARSEPLRPSASISATARRAR